MLSNANHEAIGAVEHKAGPSANTQDSFVSLMHHDFLLVRMLLYESSTLNGASEGQAMQCQDGPVQDEKAFTDTVGR